MSNFLNISFDNPFKFYPNTLTPGIHFDDDWFFNRIKSFETKARYYQKWKRGDTTPIQVEATAAPDALKIYGTDGKVKKSINFANVANGLASSIYEAVLDIDSLPDSTYFLYIKSGAFEAISEPIRLANSWPNTLLIKYQNSINKGGMTYITGLLLAFRCEAGIMDFQPDHDRFAYVNQTHDITTLSSTAFRQYKLYIGDAAGVAPYVLDILNRIFGCDYVSIEGLQYQVLDGAKWEVNRVKGYPMYGASIDIAEAFNKEALQLNDAGTGADGGIEAYDIDTDFFGNADTLHITDIETD